MINAGDPAFVGIFFPQLWWNIMLIHVI
jgi:hypothetical protein